MSSEPAPSAAPLRRCCRKRHHGPACPEPWPTAPAARCAAFAIEDGVVIDCVLTHGHDGSHDPGDMTGVSAMSAATVRVCRADLRTLLDHVEYVEDPEDVQAIRRVEGSLTADTSDAPR